ncbi:hypothetical protein [Pontibacillus yanchengensis]|nr:hypothetical protein [Pontibacillus yanchengensis]
MSDKDQKDEKSLKESFFGYLADGCTVVSCLSILLVIMTILTVPTILLVL